MFHYEYMTQTEIGALFGATSHEVGKWLVEIGLRTPGKTPSDKALGSYVKQAPTGTEGYLNWVWHSERTVTRLEAAGHRRIYNPPLNLVEPPRLNGPFTRRANDTNGFDIINGDGSVAIVVSGMQNADCLLKMLNVADKGGFVAQYMGGK